MTQKRKALVTGGSGAIGSAICRRLAASGFAVLVHAHSKPEQARAVADDIIAAGGAADVVTFDVRDGAATARALQTVLEAGPVHALIHNAGIHDDAPLAAAL